MNDRILYKVIASASLKFKESTDFSQHRWNAYKLYVIFRLPHKTYSENVSLNKTWESRLLQHCNKLLPSDCGYDIMSVSVVPMIVSSDFDA